MEGLRGFWENVAEVWRLDAFGLSVGEVIMAGLIVAASVILRRAVANAIAGSLGKLARRTKTDVDDKLVEGLRGPLSLAPVALGVFFAGEVIDLNDEIRSAIVHMTQSLIAITLFWALRNVVDPFGHLLKPVEERFSITLAEWIRKAVKGGIIFMMAVAVLQIWGVPVLPVLASLSLLSVAVALGAQNLFKNLIGGALVIAERRFKPGDWIRVDGVVEGVVEKVSFRSTMVRRFDKAPVYVPNSALSDAAVTNFSAMQARRVFWTIGVEYRTTAEQLREIVEGVRAYLTEGPEAEHYVQEGAPLFVKVDAFGASSIDIMVYCFTKTTQWGEWLEHKEKLAYAIKEIVEGAGADFAFPSTSLYVESLPGGDAPEAFRAPGAKGVEKAGGRSEKALPAHEATDPSAPATTG